MRRLAPILLLVLAVSGCSRALTNYRTLPGPRFAASPTESPDTGLAAGLKVVTWNVKWARQPEAAARVLATEPRLRDADLVFLQEMNEIAVATIAARLGSGYVYYPATLHPQVGRNFGNAILSRWPLLDDRKLVLPHLGLVRRTGRAAVVATAVVRGRRIRVYSLHLATPFEVGYGGIKDQLSTVIRDAESSPDPVVIAGDLNSSTVGGLLVDAGFSWLTQHVGPTVWINTIDHVFVRGLWVQASAGAVQDKPLPSDHRPVWAVMQIEASTR